MAKWYFLCECVNYRQRQKETERDIKREKEKDRKRAWERHKERERKTDRDRERHKEREREIHKERERGDRKRAWECLCFADLFKISKLWNSILVRTLRKPFDAIFFPETKKGRTNIQTNKKTLNLKGILIYLPSLYQQVTMAYSNLNKTWLRVHVQSIIDAIFCYLKLKKYFGINMLSHSFKLLIKA